MKSNLQLFAVLIAAFADVSACLNFIADGGASIASRGVSVSDGSISLSMKHSPRIYMLDDGGSKYEMFNLVGKQISFDVDISRVPCDYNLALYFSEMSQSASIGSGYCDAQGQGYACAEMDIFEANLVASHLTSHPCEGSICDKSGAHARQEFAGSNIDTSVPFHVSTQFISDESNTLIRVEQTFRQKNNIVGSTLSISDGLASMGRSFENGMVLTMSIWTAGPGGMPWLNGQCGSFDSNTDGIKGVFTNITVSSVNADQPHSFVIYMNESATTYTCTANA